MLKRVWAQGFSGVETATNWARSLTYSAHSPTYWQRDQRIWCAEAYTC